MKQHILIVDDEIGIRLLLEDLFKSEGYEVYTAQTGKEALEMINIHTIDLMMIDYKLPIMDGIEVVKKIHEEKRKLFIIMMSGLVENIPEDITNYPNVAKVLSKPFNVLEVKELVNNILSKKNECIEK